jgi:hypothetical protein
MIARAERRFDLGDACQPPIVHGVRQKSDACAIARQEQAAAKAVPYGDWELPIQMIDKVGPVLLVQMDDDPPATSMMLR